MLISRAILEPMLSGGIDLSDQELGDCLTSLGLELEAMERVGEGLEAIVVAEVRSVKPHPKADKLRLCEVDDGSGTKPVVCGAPNVPDPGGKVAFAPVGTTLPGGLTIGAREIRGERSEGMICSEAELEIGTDADGIMVLPSDWKPGARLCDLVPGIIDTVYELGVTPNRGDALGHVGVARDLAVKLRKQLALPELALPDAPSDPSLVTLEAPDRCGRYFGYAFDGASVGEAPLWMRVGLHRLGLRPINAVVDITNYVLMEYGQPLHIFDRKRLGQGRVVIRRARAGEPMKTLDDRALELSTEDLVIADAAKPQALAGVMGGLHSGVEHESTQLLLEAAWFQPVFVRRSARRHQLSTDSSFRFERGVDHGENLRAACARAASLVVTLTGAKTVGGHEAVGERPAPLTIRFRPARSRLVLGLEVPADEAQRILRGLQVEVDASDAAAWACIPPTHRLDLGIEEDLIEELMRHHGLDELPMTPTLPSEAATALPAADVVRTETRLRQEDTLVDALRSVGLREHVAFVFAGEDKLAPLLAAEPGRKPVALSNPMRQTAGVLRTHMLPGLLEALSLNAARHTRPARLFELGRVYAWESGQPQTAGPTAEIDAVLPTERRRAAVLLGGRDEGELSAREVGGLLLDALARSGYRGELAPLDGAHRRPWLHPGAQAKIVLPEVGDVGVFGEVHPDVLADYDLPTGARAVYGELDVDVLPLAPVATFREVPRFPATARDLSLEIPVDLPAAVVVAALRSAETDVPAGEDDPPRLASGDSGSDPIEVLEDYRGEGIPAGHRALLLRLHYRARERSVTDTEVQRRHQAIVEQACQRLSAQAPNIRAR